MRTLANILWHFPFFGFLSALGAFLLGVLFLITVIGAPIGLGLIQFSRFLLTPFSSSMIDKKDLGVKQNKLWLAFGFIIRIFYFPFGLILAFVTIIQIALLFITIIGIPIALVLAKSLGTYFNPVNKVCVSKAVKDEIQRRKAEEQVNQMQGFSEPQFQNDEKPKNPSICSLCGNQIVGGKCISCGESQGKFWTNPWFLGIITGIVLFLLFRSWFVALIGAIAVYFLITKEVIKFPNR